MELTLDEFIILRDYIYEKTGLFFAEKKLYFLKTRVGNRIKETNSSSVKEYCRFLKYSNSDEELRKLINVVTTNETYFFRDLNQINAYADEILPAIVESKKKTGDSRIKVWSAACSTGDEPYTLAILLKEKSSELSSFTIEIVASDIDTDVLNKCLKGVYTPRAVKDVPEDILYNYFTFDGENYILSDEIKNMVTFKRLNLFDSSAVRNIRNVDILFCRNVLIYFDDLSKKQVINDFASVLHKDGFLLLGVGESLGRISASFKLVRLKSMLAYKK